MRNSSIVLSLIGLSILVFGLIASFVVKNQQVASIAVLASVAIFGISGLLTSFASPSPTKILQDEYNDEQQISSIWQRIHDLKDECNKSSDENSRWYQNELDALYTRLDDLESKRK